MQMHTSVQINVSRPMPVNVLKRLAFSKKRGVFVTDFKHRPPRVPKRSR